MTQPALDMCALPDRSRGEVGSVIWHLQCIASTNEMLKRLVHQGSAWHGTVIVADEQVAGKGRQGRVWHSPAGAGLFCSVLIGPLDVSLTYCLAALAVRDAIADVVDMRPDLKWPNDLLIHGRKVSGILVEQVRQAAVVGIGVNTNMSEDQLATIGPEATSLAAVSGKRIPHTDLLKFLLERIQEQYIRISQSSESVFRDWRRALVTIGQTVEVETSREKWIGRAVDVASDGALLVTNDKRLVRVYAANVRIRS